MNDYFFSVNLKFSVVQFERGLKKNLFQLRKNTCCLFFVEFAKQFNYSNVKVHEKFPNIETEVTKPINESSLFLYFFKLESLV